MAKPPRRPNYDCKLAREIMLADGTWIATLARHLCSGFHVRSRMASISCATGSTTRFDFEPTIASAAFQSMRTVPSSSTT